MSSPDTEALLNLCENYWRNRGYMAYSLKMIARDAVLKLVAKSVCGQRAETGDAVLRDKILTFRAFIINLHTDAHNFSSSIRFHEVSMKS